MEFFFLDKTLFVVVITGRHGEVDASTIVNLTAEKFDPSMLSPVPTPSATSLHPLACYGF